MKKQGVEMILIRVYVCIAFVNTFTTVANGAEIEISDNIWRPSLEDYSPSTLGWKAINDRRFKQLATSNCTADDRYSFYSVRTTRSLSATILASSSPCLLIPSFTYLHT